MFQLSFEVQILLRSFLKHPPTDLTKLATHSLFRVQLPDSSYLFEEIDLYVMVWYKSISGKTDRQTSR